MSKAMTLIVGERGEETSRFCDIFNKFFDCLNVRSLSAGKLSRDAFKAPYRSANDFRLKVYYNCMIPKYCLIYYIYTECIYSTPECMYKHPCMFIVTVKNYVCLNSG